MSEHSADPTELTIDSMVQEQDRRLNVLIVHNNYGKPSGEEAALETITQLLESNGHRVLQFRKSSASIVSKADKARAFFSGIHSFRSQSEIEKLIARESIDLVHVQNLFPLISPSVLSVIKRQRIPIVMRCPNYRLLCPSGLHLLNGKICERCLGFGS